MWKRKNSVIIILAILMGMSFIPGINFSKTHAENPGPFFSISILAPNTNPA